MRAKAKRFDTFGHLKTAVGWAIESTEERVQDAEGEDFESAMWWRHRVSNQ